MMGKPVYYKREGKLGPIRRYTFKIYSVYSTEYAIRKPRPNKVNPRVSSRYNIVRIFEVKKSLIIREIYRVRQISNQLPLT